MTYTTEDFPINLDNATELDVIAIEAFCRETRVVPFAFAHGLGINEARVALDDLAAYAKTVREAREFRKAGKICHAMVLERVNEDRYAALPEVLRW